MLKRPTRYSVTTPKERLSFSSAEPGMPLRFGAGSSITGANTASRSFRLSSKRVQFGADPQARTYFDGGKTSETAIPEVSFMAGTFTLCDLLFAAGGGGQQVSRCRGRLQK